MSAKPTDFLSHTTEECKAYDAAFRQAGNAIDWTFKSLEAFKTANTVTNEVYRDLMSAVDKINNARALMLKMRHDEIEVLQHELELRDKPRTLDQIANGPHFSVPKS